MIRTFKQEQSACMKMNVVLRDNTHYLGCDMTESPFGVAGMVGFWKDDVILIIPLDLVKSLTLYSD